MIGSVLVNYIAGRMFMGSIVKKVYQIRNYKNFEEEAKKGLNSTLEGKDLDRA